jgi:hypothetical protein
VITSWRGEAELDQLPVLFLKAGHLCELTRPPFARPACGGVLSGAVWQRGIVSLVSDVLFADRSGLIEISEARTTFGENLRPQLDRVCAQIGVNGLAVEVAGEFYFQPGFF